MLALPYLTSAFPSLPHSFSHCTNSSRSYYLHLSFRTFITTYYIATNLIFLYLLLTSPFSSSLSLTTPFLPSSFIHNLYYYLQRYLPYLPLPVVYLTLPHLSLLFLTHARSRTTPAHHDLPLFLLHSQPLILSTSLPTHLHLPSFTCCLPGRVIHELADTWAPIASGRGVIVAGGDGGKDCDAAVVTVTAAGVDR